MSEFSCLGCSDKFLGAKPEKFFGVLFGDMFASLFAR